MVVWPNGWTAGLTVMERRRSSQTWSPAVGPTEHSAPPKRRKQRFACTCRLCYFVWLTTFCDSFWIEETWEEGKPLLCGAGLKKLYSVLFFSFGLCFVWDWKGEKFKGMNLSFNLKLLLAFTTALKWRNLQCSFGLKKDFWTLDSLEQYNKCSVATCCFIAGPHYL